MNVQGSEGACKAAPIRVLLADDHAVTLWGLRQLVSSVFPRMSVSGTATTCGELLNHAALRQTDVVLLDLGLGDGDALHCLGQLVNDAGVKVVLLTGELDPRCHREAVMRGARGVVVKSQSTDDILHAIEQVHAGHVCLQGSLMSMLLDSLPGLGSRKAEPEDDDSRRIKSLTAKERQVVGAVVKHRGAKGLVVAEALGMSEHTLRNHLTVIYSKLELRGKLDLYVYALEHGIGDAKGEPAQAAKLAALAGEARRPSLAPTA